ncbi:unnamed protein product [Didymodactylos carnosus]|uniref:Alpha-(1,6)-fucosyltransferase N- and catalytic domain-containing protein n=1 Tax=Didymodactylos carnosus TaxID=1234261 RepID=A0A815Z6H6_9BILA|nr:unnamed protein product [Didymodactylos carnosus]CAF4448189.1 unnamed protein product [Didymodactylos carnosus]
MLVQQWLHKHQNPDDCSKARIAIINNYAWSGLGSTIHQVVWAVAKALADDRIFVYANPGTWIWAQCEKKNPDCFFLPVTNCSSLQVVDNNRVIIINANGGYFGAIKRPFPFSNRTFNWWRTQLAYYMIRFNERVTEHIEQITNQTFPQGLEHARPLIAVFIRRSDKIAQKEMLRAYSLREYFDLFDSDAKRALVRNVYLNSEDEGVFDEFKKNLIYSSYYRLFYINQTRGYVFHQFGGQSAERLSQIALNFLTDLYIEANADMHVGTLSSNWCRLVDELRLSAGKKIPYYTPEEGHYQGF